MKTAEFLRNIIAKDQVFEIRVKIKYKNFWRRGYFNYDDIGELDKSFKKLYRLIGGEDNIEGYYFTPNSLDPNIIFRSKNEFNYGECAKDKDIIKINYILLDFDPIRPSGISSTNEEKILAYELLKEVMHELNLFNLNPCIISDSGNGFHLMFRNDDCSNKTIITFLELISNKFSNDKITIDKKVGNPSRIWKLYGTMTRKGSNTEDRPWRESKVIEFIDNAKPIKNIDIQKYIFENDKNHIEKHIAESKQCNFGPSHGKEYLESFMSTYLNITNHKMTSFGELWEVDCPFNSEHKKKGYITFTDGLGWSFKCHHNSCKDKTWKHVKNMFIPDKIDLPNYRGEPKLKIESCGDIGLETFNEPIENFNLSIDDNVPFPYSVFSNFILETIDAISEETQASKDLLANLIIGAYSGASSNKFRVDIVNQPLNLYMAIKMPSSCRKSTAYEAIFNPFNEYQMSVFHKNKEELKDLQNEKTRIRNLISGTGSNKNNDVVCDLNQKITNIEEEINAKKNNKSNKYIIDDATTEKIIKILDQNDNRLLISSSEGSPLSNIIRTYGSDKNNKPSIDLFLKGYSGELFSFSRVTNDIDIYLQPYLTIVITGQDKDINEFFNNNYLIQRGLISRFLFISPTYNNEIDFNKTSNYKDLNIYKQYSNHVKSIIDNKTCNTICVKKDAVDCYINYATKIHKIANDNDEIDYCESLKYWLSKHHMRMVRLSGILNIMNNNNYNHLIITEEDMLKAEMLSEYYYNNFTKSLQVFNKKNKPEFIMKLLKTIMQFKSEKITNKSEKITKKCDLNLPMRITKAQIRRYVTRNYSIIEHNEIIDLLIKNAFMTESNQVSKSFIINQWLIDNCLLLLKK